MRAGPHGGVQHVACGKSLAQRIHGRRRRSRNAWSQNARNSSRMPAGIGKIDLEAKRTGRARGSPGHAVMAPGLKARLATTSS